MHQPGGIFKFSKSERITIFLLVVVAIIFQLLKLIPKKELTTEYTSLEELLTDKEIEVEKVFIRKKFYSYILIIAGALSIQKRCPLSIERRMEN